MRILKTLLIVPTLLATGILVVATLPIILVGCLASLVLLALRIGWSIPVSIADVWTSKR